ncbi:hypothetical protein VP1G_11115 [Cytospora mali]|uniref:Uncharacterized protein n=1 Tax=Cytospora mali TaxID=578113 RepID=A0A194V6C4_CYTMA|nr:hypothetical protein VP1G_11115 [Valsa mali var. pyri (nom. inval.)]
MARERIPLEEFEPRNSEHAYKTRSPPPGYTPMPEIADPSPYKSNPPMNGDAPNP